MKKVECINEDCENQFVLGQKGKPGLYRECYSCGEKTERSRGNVRLGGIMHYAHKTAPTLVIMNLDDAKEINRKTDRVGGQGIIKGMAEQR